MSAVPTKYQKDTSFVSIANVNSWSNAAPSLDAELAKVQVSVGQTIDRLSEVQADDGTLKNGIVGYESFSDALKTQVSTVTSISTMVSQANATAATAVTTANAAQTSAAAATSAAQSAIDALTGKSDVNHTHSSATSLASGFMSATDKAKMDAIPTATLIHFGVTFGGTY